MAEHCPHCNANLQGAAIPQQLLDSGAYGNNTHYSRKIGVEVRGVYDGVLYYRCPDCGGTWHRWPSTSNLHDRAILFIHGREDYHNV